MKNISIVKDKIDGSTFAVLIVSKSKKINAYGSKGQGETWAEWINSSEMSFDEAVDSLDMSLIVEKPSTASSANIEQLSKFMRPEEILDLQSEINQKSLLEIVETKSLIPQQDEEDDLPDFTPISEWPITDIEIAAIDVSYKQNAVDYKAKAFMVEKNLSSLMYEVKGYRAIWDTNISSWRCPEDTLNGGQFTNRMGRGCTTGMVRRLGQFLMSVDDRNTIQPKLPGIEEPQNALYRAGKLIDTRAEASREKFVDKTKNRANRRQQRTNLNPRFTDLYGALNPDKPALTRARTAAGLKLQRIGSDMAQQGFSNMGNESKRRARRIKKVTDLKFPGGSIGKKLRQEGGIIPNSRLGGYYVMVPGGTDRVIDLNEMVPIPFALKKRKTLFNVDGLEIPNPFLGFNFVTRKEATEMINEHQNGLFVNGTDKSLSITDINQESQTFNRETVGMLIEKERNGWESIATGKISERNGRDFSKRTFMDYDEMQIKKAEMSLPPRHERLARKSGKMQSFEGLEKLESSDPRIAEFESRFEALGGPPMGSFGPANGAYIDFMDVLPDNLENTLLGPRPEKNVLRNNDSMISLRISPVMSPIDASLPVVTLQADYYNDDGSYFFTAVHSFDKNKSIRGGLGATGRPIGEFKTDFYVLASKPSKSINAVETEKSIKNGEISEHFRTHGGKNPLTDRGGFISTDGSVGNIDLDAMVPIVLFGPPANQQVMFPFDSEAEALYQREIRNFLNKGFKFITRDEMYAIENTVMDARKIPRQYPGLGGDSPTINSSWMAQQNQDYFGAPYSLVRAFSSKDFEYMIGKQDTITMSHLDDKIWKKAIRRKEKDSLQDFEGFQIGSTESKLAKVRQNLGAFIESFDPLASEDAKNRRKLRRVEKKSSKEKKKLADAANLNDIFDESGDADKLNLRKLIERHTQTKENFRMDIRRRGDYQGKDFAREGDYADSNQLAGNPTYYYEILKTFFDQVLEDNDVFGADPASVSGGDFIQTFNTFMQEISQYAQDNNMEVTFPLLSFTNFRIVEKTDGLGTKKVAVREQLKVIIYDMGTIPDFDGNVIPDSVDEKGVLNMGIETTEIQDLTDKEILDIENGDISFDSLRDRFNEADDGRDNELSIHFDRAGDALIVDGGYSASIPYRGSKNEKVEIFTNSVSGKITTPKADELGDTRRQWNNKEKKGKRKPSNRKTTGQSPKKPGIVERFLSGETRREVREREASERLQQGRMPRSTDSVREKLFKRMGQISNRMKGEPDPLEVYPTIPSRINPVDARTRVLGPDAIWNPNSGDRVMPGLISFPVPPDVNQSEWKNDSDNIRRITDLNDSLNVLGGFRPRITQEDRDREAELFEIYDEWKKDLDNPLLPEIEGSPSNFGHALVVEEKNSYRGDERIVVYDMRQPHTPPIAIIETDSTGVSHLLDKDGKHLMSIVEANDINGNKIMVPIIGPAARKQFEERERIPGFIERMTGKFRKRKPTSTPAVSMSPRRLARRGVVRSKSDRSGIFYPQRATGDFLPGVDSLSDSQKTLLSNSVSSILDNLEQEFRRHLKLSDTDELLEDDILDHIDDLSKLGQGPLSGIRKSALHDMLVLMDAQNSGDLQLINDLKPARRNFILSEAGVSSGIATTKSRVFRPYGPTRPSSPATAVSSSPQNTGPRTPVELVPSIRRAVPPRRGKFVTGPALTSEVGNPSLGISFQNGNYVDDATGELIEDLSGLILKDEIIYTPHTVNTDGYFPSVPVANSVSAIRPSRIIKIAPGVDPSNPDIAGSNDPRRVFQLDSVTQTFNEAAKAIEDADMAIGTRLRIGFAESLPGSGFDSSHNRDPAVLRQAFIDSAEENGLYEVISDIELNQFGAITPNQLDDMGLGGPGPVRDAYFVGEVTNQADMEQKRAVIAINGALKAQYILEEMIEASSSLQATQNWESVWGSNAMRQGFSNSSADLDITSQNIDAQQSRVDNLWAQTTNILIDIQKSSTDQSNNALLEIRTSRSSQPVRRDYLDNYVRYGQVAEMAEHLLRKHILSDPSVKEGIAETKIQQMEFAAKRMNARTRARANRSSVGRRNVGQLDGQPELDIHGNGQVSNVPQRTVQEIMDIHAEHRADGALEPPTIDPVTGVVQEGILDDTDIDMLSMMGRAHTQFPADNNVAGHPDLVGTIWPDTNGSLGQMMMGSWWQWSGYSSLPLLVDEQELISLLDETAPDGKPFAMAITRGVKDDGNMSATDMVNQGLRGDRFVPGQGASATGRGEYWTGELAAWPYYHGNGDGSFIAVLTRDSKIMTATVADELFTGFGSGQGDSLLYGALWSLANAHGAPDFGRGVSDGHGVERIFGVPQNSLLPDPNTGLYDVPAIEAVVDKMTDLTPGQEGIATLEGWNKSGNMPSWLSAELFPGAGATPEVIQEAQEQRREWNAWLGQHLSWFVQIAQMARDESQPGQAGVDAKEWNQKLNESRRTLLYMSRENRLATMGYDAAISGERTRNMQRYALPSKLWTGPDGLGTNRQPNVVLIFNRSSGIYYRLPTNWKTFRDRVNNSLTNKLPW